MPGGCCYGNASAIVMIGHSCLINCFFNAYWFVRTLKEQVHGKWKKKKDYFIFFTFSCPSFSIYVFLYFSLTTYLAATVSPCFKRCSNGVLNHDWKLEISMDGGRLQLGYLKCKRNVFVHGWLLCAAAEANAESNVVWILWVFKAGQSHAQHYFVLHFYSSNLLGPIMIREPSLHLWTPARVYQDLICLSPFNLIFLELH